MIDELKIDTQLVVCYIRRAKDGLALSSRNARLTPEHRAHANILNRVLLQAKEWLGQKSIKEIQSTALSFLDIPGFKPEYFDIVDGHLLVPVIDKDKSKLIVACTAVWAGDVRLIDNMILKGEL